MPSTTSAGPPDWSKAIRHLRQVDEPLRSVIDRVGPCTLAPRRDYFVALCKAIFSQQISTVAAATIFGRFRDRFPARRPTPAKTLQLLTSCDEQTWRGCGLSRQKRVYLIDLAEHFVDGRIPTRRLGQMSDEEVIDALTGVKGIGRWTAEMFLIFVLNRQDVLPVDDLGLREGVRDLYNLPERPMVEELRASGESWRPYRSIATWYVWRRNSVPADPRIPDCLP